MSDEQPVDETPTIRQSETDIEHIFEQHISTLHTQKWTIVGQINEWSTTLIRLIQEHVTSQRNLLDQAYDKKVSHLKSLRAQAIDKAAVFEQNNETKKIKLLIKKCNDLKHELPSLMYLERPIRSIQLVEQDQNEIKTEDETSSSPNTKPISPSNDEQRSIDNDYRIEQQHVSKYNETSEKCPICFMIFPKSMTTHDRNIHVNEHY